MEDMQIVPPTPRNPNSNGSPPPLITPLMEKDPRDSPAVKQNQLAKKNDPALTQGDFSYARKYIYINYRHFLLRLCRNCFYTKTFDARKSTFAAQKQICAQKKDKIDAS
jgi:predicted nucleic-acid-binding Zn-ribbon protein